MKNQLYFLFFLLSFVFVTPAWAQSNASYSIIAGDHRFDLSGGLLTIELTNIAEDFFLASLELDGKIMAEKLQSSTMLIEAIGPPEKNNSGPSSVRKTESTLATYPTDDGAVVVEITTRSNGTTTTTEIEVTTTTKDKDGNTSSDTIEIILSPYEPPVIRNH